jgi:trans-aconitate 2-methyltransferase
MDAVDAFPDCSLAAVSANDHFIFSTTWLDGLALAAANEPLCFERENRAPHSEGEGPLTARKRSGLSGAAWRSWDAATYERASDVQEAWAEGVLDRLALRGDETVLDAGCGPGRVTRRLLERLPRGRVIAVDSSEEMVDRARRTLTERATVLCSDLTQLELDEPVDAVFSNAVFHWVLDQDRLFARMYATLRPGGRLVAGCGGQGNVERFLATVDSICSQPPFARHLTDFERAWRFPGPEETEALLRSTGFAEARAWLEESDVTPADPAAFLRAAPLRCHLQRLPENLHEHFVREVLRRCGEPLRLDYRRLQIEGRRPAAS